MASPSYNLFGIFSRKFEIKEATPPADVNEAFSRYAEDGKVMTSGQLRRFLVEVQGMKEAEADPESERIYEQMTQKPDKNGLSLADFFAYLFDGDLNGPINTQVHNDMTAPLQHYFIYTGHNSYLTGNQLSSDCSDVPIIMALQRGVRVIELDIWPNSTEDDVDVLHGRTLTTPVPLLQCLKSIREHAFDVSPYPVIITLEDHLTADLQAKVAKMVIEIFGTMLFHPDSKSLEKMPSPEELKYKIMLSTKPPKEYLEQSKENPGQQVGQKALENETPSNNDSDPEEEDSDGESGSSKAAPEYKQLIAIRAGKPKNGVQEEFKVVTDKVRRLSLNEQALENAALEFGSDVVRFTQKNFLRIYPKGTRIGSSNYPPMVAWSHGAQMVAFNMQGHGKQLWKMQGMFRSNGGCGYVKKPEILMKRNAGAEEDLFNPEAPLPVKKTLKVTVYMGTGWNLDFEKTHFDSFSPPDFYTKLQVVGVEADCRKERTKVVEDSWVPIWNEEISFALRVPELALLQIEVKDRDMSEKDDFGGQICLRISEIKPGFRAVPLFNKEGDELSNTKLLMKFAFV